MMELHIINPLDTDKHREVLIPYLDSFLERSAGRYTIEDIFERIVTGTWTLWVVHKGSEVKAVLLTQNIQYPRLQELQIIMCVGEGQKEWYFLISHMEEYARLTGCSKITAITRPGWERVMQGYKKTHIYLERDL